ncbi:MAG: phosphoribosyl-AMP cyclohydrolase [Desulfurococcales archaeon]|nr:phosphoribosyl-AMP cyclohydrolase [Desulfurococcales archaeon]
MARLQAPKSPLDLIDFEKQGGLVPVVVQDASTGKILMLGYANREALRLTLETGYAHFYSRSRRRLWMKGETSGNRVKVLRVDYDCDSDTVLYLAVPEGPVCHTGKYSCFHNTLHDSTLEEMWNLIVDAFRQARVVERPGEAGLDKYLYIVNPLTDNIPPPSPLLQSLIAEYLASKAGEGLDKVVSPEVLGLPIASLVAQKLGLPLAIVRERPFPAEGWVEPFQSGYKKGTHYVYGVSSGEKVVLVDDAVSTGGAAASIIEALRRNGVRVEAVMASIAKPQYGGVERLESMGLPVYRAVDVYIEEDRIRLVQPEAGWTVDLPRG